MDKGQTSDTDSLGILSMDGLKVFGETSTNSSKKSCNNKTCERLIMERKKAIETLQKPQKLSVLKTPKKDSESDKIWRTPKTPNFDDTDYVTFGQLKSINISDLVTDKTIYMENSSRSSSNGKERNISFEPSEITGRSTLYRKDSKTQNKTTTFERFSVSDILASSFAPKARNLCESLRDRATSGVSSSLTSFNASRSLPRTADMSLSKLSAVGVESSFNSGASCPFSFGPSTSAYNYDDESFAPAEMMRSQLLSDEISWAQQCAAIPTNALSEEAKAKIANRKTNGFDSSSVSSNINFRSFDRNISLGNFFNMRSENISNIVKHKSPEMSGKPVALVDVSDKENTVTSDLESALTPKIDNKTYSQFNGGNSKTNAYQRKKKHDEKHESKDSGNITDNSNLLSVSAIDKAMFDLNVHTDDSGMALYNRILECAKNKKSKSNLKKSPKHDEMATENINSNRFPTNVTMKSRTYDNLNSITELIAENKENLDPQAARGSMQMSETLSFTDSLLDTSASKQLQRTSQTRSPLSPINIDIPRIQVTEEDQANEADDEAFPGTPLKSTDCRVRRNKSPRERIGLNPKIILNNNDTPSNNAASKPNRSACTTSNKKPKSLCSTRIEVEKKVASNYDFVTSPNLGKSVVSSLTVNRNNSRSISPATNSDCSPISSPRSCFSSQASPTSGFRSPQLDITTNSERRYLTANGGAVVQKTASSPNTGESSPSSTCSKYGVPPGRTASANSLRNGFCIAGAVGRSVSRCSNSSEFSHRDGKLIPLKVTSLELSWSSTKLRTDARKSMQVKNIANKRLVVRMEIHGPGFQIISSSSQSNTLNLQSQECRSIVINFCPTVTGPAIGMLSFHSPQGTANSNVSFLDIPLFGYGGHATVVAQNMLIGPVGAHFLPMGDISQLSHPLERSFRIYNKGPLLAFAIVCIDSLGLNLPCLSDTIEVRPSCMLIAPGSIVDVRLIFRPKRDDMKKIIKKITNVLTLANMRVISGDEANRQRMRRLVERMPKSEREKLKSNSLDKLWTPFPSEVEMQELEAFKESTLVTIDLLASLRIQEIALTLNHETIDDSVASSSMYFPDADETVLFRTVCVTSPTPAQNALEPVDELLEKTLHSPANDPIAKQQTLNTWSVSPTCIEFDFMRQRCTERVSLLVRNSFKSRQYFEVFCNYKNLLRFTPSEGYVEPDGGQIEVEMHAICDKVPIQIIQRKPIEIRIQIENEHITVPVKIPQDNYPTSYPN